MAVGLNECSCYHLDRNLHHGRVVREAYEDAIVNIIRNSIVHRDAEINGNFNIAVIGSGGLSQDSQWLAKLFRGRHHGITNVDLVDLGYEADNSPVNALRGGFAEQINTGRLNISSWNSCDALLAARKTHHLVIGMDTEHATPDAVRYQWRNLIRGDLEKTLIIRWNRDESGHFFEIHSRRGSEELNSNFYRYHKFADLNGNVFESITPQLVDAVVSRINQVPYTG